MSIEEYEKKCPGTPFILEIWKDKEDLRSCAKGVHLSKVEINLKLIK